MPIESPPPARYNAVAEARHHYRSREPDMAADAQSIILHQYDLSPFSEKARVILG